MKARLLLPLSPLLIAAASWTKVPAVSRSWEFVATFGVTCALLMVVTEAVLRLVARFRRRVEWETAR